MKRHQVKKGDTLSTIAGLYYSNTSLYLRIFKANPYLDGRKTARLTDEDLLFPGDLLIIPEFEDESVSSIIEETGDISIEIDGKTFKGFEGLTLDFTLDTFADTFSFNTTYESGIPYKDFLKKFAFQKVKIFYKGKVILTGILPNIDIEHGTNSTVITANGYSKTGILAKANLAPSQYPRLFTGLSFTQIATQLCEPYGIDIIVSESAREQASLAYEEKEIGVTEFIGSFLTNMAKDRSLILSNTVNGNLLITSFEAGKSEVLRVDPSSLPNEKIKVSFIGDALSSDLYLVESGDAESDPVNSVFKFGIPILKPLVITQSDKSEQSPSIKIENEAKKALASANPINVPLVGWEDDNGDILLPGSIFTVNDKSLQIDNTERYAVKTVSLSSSGSSRVGNFSGVLENSLVPAK